MLTSKQSRTSHLVKADKEVMSVYETTDYDKFKFMSGNRELNDLHIRRLVKSFEKKHLVTVIVVNEKFQIIDGQHRFTVAKELKLPIRYLIVPGYGLEEVQVLNTNSANWNKLDYLSAYCDSGIEPYLEMRQFMQDFPDFGISVAEQLLTNSTGGSNNKNTLLGKRGKVRNFEEGNLKIESLSLAYDNAKKIMEFKPYYMGYKRSIFVAAMLGLFKNENYKHDEMIGKLSKNPTSLTDCANVAQYKLLLEEIYNFRRHEKVNLRY